ncbi:MAG: CHAT domain-containing protein [Candidatus Binatia bacterium]
MTTKRQSPIHLTILRKGDTNIIDLDEVDALIPRSETQVDTAFLQDLATEVMHLAMPGYVRGLASPPAGISGKESLTAVRDLERIGNLIFSHLLTEPARKRLQAADPCDLYLRLDEQLIHVPWELCHDGSNFLATKFHVGRQVITGYPIPTAATRRAAQDTLRVLLITDPTESLPDAGAEAEQLSLLLDNVPGVEVTLLGGKGARKVPLLTALQDHDIVHFAGHSYYDPTDPSKSGWRLHEGILTAGELSKLTRPPLLVFSNSCQAGATSEWAGGYRYEGQAFGIGSAFLLAGVRNYIGTFWVIHDGESVLFAATFYRGLVSGLPLGTALQQARHEVIQQRGWQGLTWASYMLYGDPAVTLLAPSDTPLQQSGFTELPSPSQSVNVRTEPQTPPRREVIVTPQKPQRRWLPGLVVSALVILTAVFLPRFPSFFSPPTQTSPLQNEYDLALGMLRSGQSDSAFATFQRIVTASNNTTGIGYDGLAALYFEKGLLPQAREALQKVLLINPTNPLALVIHGDILFSMGDQDGAIEAYTRAAQEQRRQNWITALAYNALGVSTTMQGVPEKAKEHFRAALHIDPNSLEAYGNLGYLAAAEGNQEEAHRYYRKALALYPEDELTHILLSSSSLFSPVPPQRAPDDLVLLVPFTVGGGNIRRLGEGEALVTLLSRALSSSARSELLQQSSSATERLQELFLYQNPDNIIAIAKERGANAAVWGEIQSFSRKLIVYGNLWEKNSDSVKRISSVHDGGNDKLASAARVLANRVLHTFEK